MKRVVCLFIAFLFIFSLVSCENSEVKTTEDKVRECVINRGAMEWLGLKIGGNEIRTSSATITNVRKVSEKEYIVNGKMQMTDIYGNVWTNTFDCTVESIDGENWILPDGFSYKSVNWVKR